jgi:hypothetical protein
MKKPPTVLLTGILLLSFFTEIGAQIPEPDASEIKPSYDEVNDFVMENERCLTCHAELKYTLEDTLFGRTITESMCPDNIIDRDAYYTGVHKAFACIDCHAYEYETFPHPLEARLEEIYTCLDCHGYDENFAHYNFEVIQEEFEQSIHNFDEFTCWKCHEPHSYRAFVRNAEDIDEAIDYDNSICLSCHANFDRFMLLTEREEINVVESHEWLPNQVSHFASVRCIECHTEINDTILVAHKIVPREEAVRRCADCHSRDSRLLSTLYKYQVREERRGGFINGIILNDAYVVGANQNIILDRLSLLIFGLTLLVILFHIVLRIVKN